MKRFISVLVLLVFSFSLMSFSSFAVSSSSDVSLPSNVKYLNTEFFGSVAVFRSLPSLSDREKYSGILCSFLYHASIALDTVIYSDSFFKVVASTFNDKDKYQLFLIKVNGVQVGQVNFPYDKPLIIYKPYLFFTPGGQTVGFYMNSSSNSFFASQSLPESLPYLTTSEKSALTSFDNLPEFIPPVEPDTSTASVSWAGWSNAVTSKGEYISVAWPSSVMYKLYTGDDEAHSYSLSIEEYDKNNNAVSVVYLRQPAVEEVYKKNTTYTIRATLNTTCDLWRGKNYVAKVMDNTTGTIIGSIGLTPKSDVRKIPVSPDGDRWGAEDGDTTDLPPLGDSDSIVQGGGDLPNAGTNNPDNPNSQFNLLYKFQKLVSDIWETISFAADSFLDLIVKIFEIVTTSLTSVLKFGSEFPDFLKEFFSFLPPDILMFLTFMFTLSLVVIILKFFVR